MLHNHPQSVAQPTLFGAASLWYFLAAIARNAPPWEVVPPLLFACAALATAVYNGRAALARARRQEGP